MGWLCLYALGLFAFAAVGHFLWWVGVTTLRGLFGQVEPTDPKRSPRPRFFNHCPACRASVEPHEPECSFCGLVLGSRAAQELARVRAAEAEVRGLAESGNLDSDTARTVTEQLERRARVIQGLPADTTKPARAAAARLPEFRPPARAPAPVPEPLPEPEPAGRPSGAADSPPLPEPRPPEPAPAEPPHRRGSVLAAFMEERNILWGELVGGLLIVGCSIALVVTLWNRLEAIPYFPFLLSAAVTLALFGAGQYTLHHWRLTATSRGLLVIALLLAPLNLLLLADPITRADVAVPVDVGVKLTGVLVLAWVVRTGGRDILTTRTGWRWLMALAVVGAPATQLLPAAWFAGWPIDVPAWLALGCFAGAVVAALRWPRPAGPGEVLEPAAGTALLQFVGLATFGLLAAWGLNLARSEKVGDGLRLLALPLALAAVPVVEAGLLVQRRVRAGGLRATGTGVALTGFLALTGALAAAWPDPLSVLLVTAAAGLFLTRIAFREALPWAHVGAIPALALAAVVGFHGVTGAWGAEPLAVLLRSSVSGAVLAGVALALAAVAELLVRRGSHQQAVAYGLGSVTAGVAGLFVVSITGPESPLTAAAVHAACAVGLVVSTFRWRLSVVAHGGLWLVLAGTLWALHAAIPGEMARWGFTVAVESLGFAGLALLLRGHRTGAAALLRRAARDMAVAAAILAPVVAAIGRHAPDSSWDTGTLFILAWSGLAIAGLTGAPLATYLGSAAAFLGFLHLGIVTGEWKPHTLAVLVGSLAQATAATVLAFLLRRRERVFARPLRTTALAATVLAALMLGIPTAGLALGWAGCAAWLGLVWLALALAWRERGTFAGFQIAFSVSAVFVGVAWVNAQDWRPETAFGLVQPAALHAYAIALGLLALGWVALRRAVRPHAAIRELWGNQSWSAERIVLAAVVLAQLVLAAGAILPEVRAELTAEGLSFSRWESPLLGEAFGSGAWLALAVLSTAVLASWRFTGNECDTDAHLVGVVLLLLTIPVLWAGRFAHEVAAASALRWGLGAAFVVGTGIVAARNPLRAGLTKSGFPIHTTRLTRPVLLAMLGVAAGVVVFLSAQVAELGLTGHKPSGPHADSVFARMGVIASNLVPLALVVLGLAGTAVRERSTGYALAGGLLFVATLAAGYALGVVTAGRPIDPVQQIRIWLLASGGAAIWAAAWLAAQRRVGGGPLLMFQTCFGLGLLAWGALAAALQLIVDPTGGLNPAWAEFGQLGWFPLALAAGTAVWQGFRNEPRLTVHAIGLAAAVLGVIIGCAALPWDTEGRWLSFHWLAGAWVIVGFGLVVAARRTGEPSLWLDGFAAVLTILAIRGGWHDPWRPWMPAGLAAAAAAIVGTTALFTCDRPRVAISGLLVNLAAVLLWLPGEPHTISGFLLANATGLAVAAAVWTAISLRRPESGWLDFTDLARGIALALLGLGLAPTLAGDRLDSHWLSWGATLAVAVAMAVALWEPRALVARDGLFATGVAAVLLGVAATTALPVWAGWQTPVALAVFSVLVAGVGVQVGRTPKPPFGLPERGDDWGWLLVAQGVVAAGVLAFGVSTGLTAPELLARLASPASVLILVVTATVLLRVMADWVEPLRLAVLALSVVVGATAAWSVPDPAGVAPWLERNAWLFVALAAAGVIGSELGPRLGWDWRRAARTIGGGAAGLAVVVLVVNIAQQVPLYDREARHTPLEPAAVFGILAATLALIVLAVRFALRPERDPLHLPDHRRTAYVYLAELLLVLFFTHIRFNVPELFIGAAVRYWTFAVMGLAFVGIGLAEFFERRHLDVLAGPLRRTGVLLPLIPLLAFWAKPPAALGEFAGSQAPGLSPFLAYLEKLPQHFDTYAWLWFLAGGVYGLVALSRKSFGWALLAALATNAGLWSLLTHHEVPFAVHPQVWVIPLALVILASEHINRRRLRPEVSNGVRYLGVTMIYVASAADMFIAGVGQSVWLPVILALLCVAGVLLGILTGVRAFLFLGVGFLLLDIFAMIWHAAVNLQQTWVWYASGIVLGVAILALFAVFEKRKKRHGDV